MMWFNILVLIFACIYVWIVAFIFRGWKALPNRKIVENNVALKGVSLIIVARNEARFLPNLLLDITHLEYPSELLEVIIIDDDSEDDTKKIADQFVKDFGQGKVFSLHKQTKSAKKEGIMLGVKHATFDQIASTDADCRLPATWLLAMQLTDEEDLLCGPVSYLPRNAMVSKAVELDLLSLTAMAGSTIQLRLPLLANGANMVYRKSAFNQLNGYDAKGGYDQASGDDIFLLKKIAEQPEYRIGYAKNRAALVETQMSPNLKAFVQQRIRWASKNKRTIGEPGSYLTFLLTLCYVFFAMSPIAAILFSSAGLWALVLVTWMMKFLVDYGLFSSVSKTFQKEHLMKYLWLAELLHPYYIVFTAALSLILPYTWKDRTIING